MAFHALDGDSSAHYGGGTITIFEKPAGCPPYADRTTRRTWGDSAGKPAGVTPNKASWLAGFLGKGGREKNS
jgi:hypothetical protein